MLTSGSPSQIRERLQSAAGLWRGVTRMRDSLGGDGEKFGGTPVFQWAVVSESDALLLGPDMPVPFLRRVDLETCVQNLIHAEMGLSNYFARYRRPGNDLPTAWRTLLSGRRQQMVWFQPKSRSVPDRQFSDAIESLVPIERQEHKYGCRLTVGATTQAG